MGPGPDLAEKFFAARHCALGGTSAQMTGVCPDYMSCLRLQERVLLEESVLLQESDLLQERVLLQERDLLQERVILQERDLLQDMDIK